MNIKYLIILLFCVLTKTLYSQSFFDISENSKYYVECVNIGSSNAEKYEIKMHHIPSQNVLLSYSFTLDNNNYLKSVELSPDGKTLVIKSNVKTSVIDVLSKSEIKQFKGEKRISFPNYDNFFLVDDGLIKAYDSFSGDELITYQKSEDKGTFGRNIWISKDDKYLISQDQGNSILLWRIGDAKLLKKFSGSRICFDYLERSVTVFRAGKAYIFNNDNFSFVSKQDLSKLIKKFVNDQKKDNNEIKVIANYRIPSQNGSFVFTPFIYKSSTLKNLLLISTLRNEFNPIVNGDLGKFDTCYWVNDSSIFLFYRKGNSKLISISNNINISEVKIKNNDIIKSRISPDYKFIIKPSFNFVNPKIVIKSTNETKKWRLDKVRFISYTPDSKFIIVEKNKKQGVLSSDKDFIFFPFIDSLIPIKEIPSEDTETPENYKNYKINSYKDISERKDTSLINIVLKNIEVEDSVVSINVHLIDDNGVYYYGATSEKGKKIWCNFIIKDINNNIRQISDFEIIEHVEKDTIPAAIAIVMDHSGSMGEGRTYKLQNAVQSFIQIKRKQDAIALIKYDSKIGIESFPETNKKILLNNLQINGYGKFGGGTSLLDATNTGVQILRKQKKYDRKIVIVLTDGYENSSFISQTDVVRMANENNIQINTLGFGLSISEQNLKYLSNNTEGSFYRIYKQNDFDWIFNDIYNKINNYYQIRFKLKDYGKFQAIMKICYSNSSDTMSLNFKKMKIIDKLKAEGNDNFLTFSEISNNQKEESITLNKFNDIKDFENIKTETFHEVEKNIIYDSIVNITIIEEEFEKVKFPDIKFKFDKTEIVEGSDNGIENVADFLKKYNSLRIEIGGHTDDKGDVDYNSKLSLQRAETIKTIIVQMGIDPKRIETKGYGEFQNITDNETDDNRLINRRVEFNIIQ